MKTAKLILLCLSGMFAMQSATAQSRSEKKAQTERNVREAINADHYKINVDYMQPMKGRSRALTSDYSIEIRNDSVFSYLPTSEWHTMYLTAAGKDRYLMPR